MMGKVQHKRVSECMPVFIHVLASMLWHKTGRDVAQSTALVL
jgi:hypothetical protein